MVYTDEERKFFKDYVYGHTYLEIKNEFENRFKKPITTGKIKSYLGNNKLTTGLTGRFKKGCIPYNKGVKGVYYKGSEKTWFKKGCAPLNHREVNSERINKDGYIEIKIAEPNKWVLKHRHVWETRYGKIPKGNIIIFRDNNKTNVDINNLICISKRENAMLNNTGLSVYKKELKDTAINIVRLKGKINDIRKIKNNS